VAYLSRCKILAYEVRPCAESKLLRILFAFSFLPHIVFSFAGHLAGFILVGKVFGKLGGSLRIRWQERVWVVKQDFHATFQDNVTFFCSCFCFCLFLQTPWLNCAHYQQPSHNFGFQPSVQKNKHPGREDTRSATKRQCSHDLFHTIFPCANMFCTSSTHPFLWRCKLKPPQNGNLKKAIIDSSRNIIHDLHDLCFPTSVLNTNKHCKCEGQKQYNMNEPKGSN